MHGSLRESVFVRCDVCVWCACERICVSVQHACVHLLLLHALICFPLANNLPRVASRRNEVLSTETKRLGKPISCYGVEWCDRRESTQVRVKARVTASSGSSDWLSLKSSLPGFE